MSAHESKRTIDHDEIRRWTEERNGKPATVKRTGDADEPGILRIDFGEEESLEPIEWDEFFDKFEDSELTFLYQEETADGGVSRFSKFVRRTPEDKKAKKAA